MFQNYCESPLFGEFINPSEYSCDNNKISRNKNEINVDERNIRKKEKNRAAAARHRKKKDELFQYLVDQIVNANERIRILENENKLMKEMLEKQKNYKNYSNSTMGLFTSKRLNFIPAPFCEKNLSKISTKSI